MAPLKRVEDAALPPVPSDGAPPPQPTKLRQGFVALAEALLKSLAEVFPECDAVDRGVQLFASLVKGDAQSEDEFIRKCHAVFQRHGAAFKAREPESLFQAADALPILRDVDFRSKWADPGFDEQSKENLWQYLQSLKLYAELFCAVPASVMGKIECVATELGERLKSGDLDLSRMDIADLGQRLLGQLGAEELANFEGSLPSIYASIAEMASSLASQAGHPDLDVEALMKSVVAGQQPGGAVDLSAVMQRLGGLVDPGSALGGGGGEGGLNPQQLLGLAQSAGPLLAALQRGGAAAPAEPAALQDRRPRAGKRRQ
jgi:hypothetical protein